MPEKNFTILINEFIRITVFYKSDGKKVLTFVVKIQYYQYNKWLEVERYDCYHDMIHKDIFDKHGNKRRVVYYPHLDEKAGLTVAILDFKENCNFIIERFLDEK